jgi:hypothetical protein
VHFVLFVILMRYPILYMRLVDAFGDPGWLPREPLAPPVDVVDGAPSGVSDCASSPAEPPKD